MSALMQLSDFVKDVIEGERYGASWLLIGRESLA
jgi:hypothetical protein